MEPRLQTLESWLKNECQLEPLAITPASEDASFRRYFRVQTQSDSLVVMDAPPDKEPLSPFLEVCGSLQQLGLLTPRIHQFDRALGFILMEDFGTTTFFDVLPDQADSLYPAACRALISMQTGDTHSVVYEPPNYDAAKLRSEMDLFPDWFLRRHLGQVVPEASQAVWLNTQAFLIRQCLSQPQVWVHRDFHSRNLMLLPQQQPGIIDFQDAVIGPITYDVVSLLKDCYVEWPRMQQLDWLQDYYSDLTQKYPLDVDFEQFINWFDLTGLQRHLKVLGIFCRLNYRDGKANYLNDLPLVAKYVVDVVPRYPQLAAFGDHFGHHIESALC